jgi:tRNA-2-methylthio-N6-dimethylallyladenosine synthase
MFKYSPREGTKAYNMKDDVDEEIKTKRLNDIIALQQQISNEINQSLIGANEIILLEGYSKKSEQFLSGRTDSNKIVIVPRNDNFTIGDYANVKINRATSATLFGDYII